MTEQINNMNSAVSNSVQVCNEQTTQLIRKFEIEVFDIDENDNGSVQYNRCRYDQPIIIEAASPRELQEKLSLYKQCGQMAKIVREITPISQQNVQQPTEQIIPETIVETQQPQIIQRPLQSTVQQKVVSETNTQNTRVQTKPRYFKVGDIEVKDDNGVIYQKQWMKLSESESSNIRVINDKTNGVVNLTGKHIEMKRWVIVKHNDEYDELCDLEESIK